MKNSPGWKISLETITKQPGGVTYELPCGQADALQRRGDELAQLYGEFVLPWLDGLKTFRHLDH
jgi:hypothetical protein